MTSRMRDESTLVQVMAQCYQATAPSHYLHDAMFTKFYVAIWGHKITVSFDTVYLLDNMTENGWDLMIYHGKCNIRYKVNLIKMQSNDVIKWKHFPRYWLFVRGIHWSLVDSLHKSKWRGALMVFFICAWINGWANTRHWWFGTPSCSLWCHCNV